MEGENHSFKSSSYKHSIIYAPCPTNIKFFKEKENHVHLKKKKGPVQTEYGDTGL